VSVTIFTFAVEMSALATVSFADPFEETNNALSSEVNEPFLC
jgi:hypothetical protein